MKIDKYYIGITNELERRINEHNKTSNRGYTKVFSKEWKLVFHRIFKDRLEAHKEEIRLKKAKNRAYLEWYINFYRVRSSIGRATPS